jgi:hypothetical protein
MSHLPLTEGDVLAVPATARRHPPSWWDELAISALEPQPFDMLARLAPAPESHDYVLYTDGSGHQNGWGAHVAIAKFNAEQKHIVRLSGNYGSTVQRNELSALLDGLFAIADHQLRRIIRLGLREVPPKNPWNVFAGDDRITVLWFTDRQNLAKALLYDEELRPLNKRSNERDLWMRYSAMAKHFCITPLNVERNVVPAQAVCDSLCTVARDALLAALAAFQSNTPDHIYSPDQWLQNHPQNSLL